MLLLIFVVDVCLVKKSYYLYFKLSVATLCIYGPYLDKVVTLNLERWESMLENCYTYDLSYPMLVRQYNHAMSKLIVGPSDSA
jgi:hypothetical protein